MHACSEAPPLEDGLGRLWLLAAERWGALRVRSDTLPLELSGWGAAWGLDVQSSMPR